MRPLHSLQILLVLAIGLPLQKAAANEDDATVRTAVGRGLESVQKAAAKYPQHRHCFSCHHQTLPLLAMATARSRGFPTDDNVLQDQGDFTRKSFSDSIEKLKEGKGIGGRAMTVGYALWALSLVGSDRDKTTDALVSYLLKTQRPEGHWTGQVSRPPLEESHVTCTVLAIQGMKRYAVPSQRADVDAAIGKAGAWLATAAVMSHEDRVARLWGLHLLGASPEELRQARRIVLKAQREDGGWAQMDEINSDAYATGQTLYVLQATGFDVADSVYQRGVRFLLKTQRSDGAWLVVSRSKPIQPYYAFDDEDPLGKNQFISVAATSWAVAALAVAVFP
jgi:N-acyl-D-amino-acid deacylase